MLCIRRVLPFFLAVFLSNSLHAKTTDYSAEADLVFDKIFKIWQNDTPFEDRITAAGFWHAANTLDTALEHLILAKKKDELKIVLLGLKFFKKSHPDPRFKYWSYWVDDYAWWGIFLTRAYEHFEEIGYSDPAVKEELLHHALNCWNRLYMDWNADGKGGIANVRPNLNSVESRKNAVTNNSFSVLSVRLHKILFQSLKNSTYLQAAKDELAWLTSGTVENTFKPSFWTYLSTNNLILESPNSTETVRSPFWFWSGDQGIFLELMRILSPGDTSLKDKMLMFADNMIASSMPIVFTDPDGVFHESNFTENSQPGYVADYAVGKGIALRYLGAYNRSIGTKKYSEFLKGNADAFLKRSSEIEFPRNWNPKYASYESEIQSIDAFWKLTLLTSGLNALNGAID